MNISAKIKDIEKRANKMTELKAKSTDQIRAIVGEFREYYDPEVILKEVGEQLETYGKDYGIHDELDDLNNRAMSLHEFNNGKLMSQCMPQEYITFAIDFSRQIQKQYDCQTVAEKAIAELATVNYVSVLDIQKRIIEALDRQRGLSSARPHAECERNKDFFYPPSDYLHACKRAELGLKLLNILNKELERANRHFLMAIQTLRMMKQPSIQVNIKTNTAVVGQNQMVQTNSHE